MLDRRAFLLAFGATLAMSANEANGAAEDAVSIPFKLRPRRIVVDAMIGGKGPFGFVLDTGGITSLIDSGFASSQKLQARGNAHLGMAGQTDRFEEVVATDILVGNAFRMREMSFASTSLIDFGSDLVGSFGVEFMTQRPGLIDFDTSLWRLFDKHLPALQGYVSQPDSMAHASRARAAYIFADVLLNDTPVRLALDTGNPGTIRLTPQAQRRTGLDRSDLPTLPQRLGGKSIGTAVRAPKASIAGIDLGQPVVVRGDRSSDVYPDGIMGLSLIRLLNFATDPNTGTLWIKRNSLSVPSDNA